MRKIIVSLFALFVLAAPMDIAEAQKKQRTPKIWEGRLYFGATYARLDFHTSSDLAVGNAVRINFPEGGHPDVQGEIQERSGSLVMSFPSTGALYHFSACGLNNRLIYGYWEDGEEVYTPHLDRVGGGWF